MKKSLIIIILFFTALKIEQVYSRAITYKGKKYSFQISEKWKVSKDVLGVPITFSGPVINSSRPVIMFTPTEIKKMKFVKGQFEKDIEDYKLTRKSWVKKHKGIVKKFDSYSRRKIKNLEFHRVGFHYEIAKNTYSEASYYVVCESELFHIKYLVRQEQNIHVSEIEKLIESFRCE